MISKLALPAVVIAAGLSMTTVVQGNVINGSFEAPATSTFTTTAPTGWTGTGFSGLGVDLKGAAHSGLTGSDGNQYFYGDGANISEMLTQDLGIGLQPNTTYTVTLDGAYRSSSGVGGAGIVFGLESTSGVEFDGTGGTISLSSEEAVPNTFVAGTPFVFTTGPLVSTGDIVAFIGTDGTFAGSGRIQADNFVLTPEPGSLGLLLLGGLPLLTRRRRALGRQD